MLCPQLHVVGGLTVSQSTVVSTQLAAFVSGTDCMRPVARAVFSALDTEAALVQFVAFKLSFWQHLLVQGGIRALTSAPNFVNRQ